MFCSCVAFSFSLYALCFLLSVLCCLLSLVCCLLSVLCCLLPVLCCLVSASDSFRYRIDVNNNGPNVMPNWATTFYVTVPAVVVVARCCRCLCYCCTFCCLTYCLCLKVATRASRSSKGEQERKLVVHSSSVALLNFAHVAA